MGTFQVGHNSLQEEIVSLGWEWGWKVVEGKAGDEDVDGGGFS